MKRTITLPLRVLCTAAAVVLLRATRTAGDDYRGHEFEFARGGSQMYAYDFDGDGIKDIITGKRFWAHMGKDPGGKEPPVLNWFKTNRQDDGQVDFIPYLIGSEVGVGTQLVVADYNGDQLLDIVVGNKKGTAYYTHTRRAVSKEVWEAAQPVAQAP